jgi:hypothetical protein
VTRRALLAAVFACGVAGLCGYVAGRLGEPPADAAASAPDSRPAVARPPAAPAQARVASRPAARPELVAEPELEPLPEATRPPARRQAFADARTMIDAAVARGRWAEHDRDQLRPLLAQLDGSQLEQLFTAIIPAMNEGRVSVDFTGPTF